MLRTRLAVFVSGGGTNLQALIDAEKSGILKSGEIVLVVSSSPKAYALERAKASGIPSVVISRKGFSTQQEYESELKKVLKEHSIELIILAGFMNILSGSFTSCYPRRILNIHPSLIPSFCGKGFYGLKVHEAALSYGVKVTGATVHFVNEVPDGGEILLQKAVEVQIGDTPEILQRRVMEQAEWIILPEAAEMVSGEISVKGNGYERIRDL